MKDAQAQKDLETYYRNISNNSLCLMIERKYGLDGYPPEIVTVGLQAKADGKDMYAALDKALGL